MSNNIKTSNKLRYDDYICFPDDGRRHEIIDGDHYMNAAPSPQHQIVSKRLLHHLYSQIELRGLGVVFYAPIDVHLTEFDVVQPDLVVLLNPKTRIITPTKIKGAPDLIVEILSPSTSKNDKTLKRSLYQKCGVTEYWIVDPFEQTLEQLVLRDGEYRPEPATSDLRPTILDGVLIPLLEVW